MSKKINYISHLNGFMQRRVYDLLSPSATTLYLVIFDAFNKSCWNFEWLKLPTRELLYRTGLSSTHTLASSRKLLMDLGYIEFQLVKHGGKVYSAYKINPLDSSGMFIDKDNEHDKEINDKQLDTLRKFLKVPNKPKKEGKIRIGDYMSPYVDISEFDTMDKYSFEYRKKHNIR